MYTPHTTEEHIDVKRLGLVAGVLQRNKTDDEWLEGGRCPAEP